MKNKTVGAICLIFIVCTLTACMNTKNRTKIYALPEYVEALAKGHSHYNAMMNCKGYIFVLLEKEQGFWTTSFSEFDKIDSEILNKITFPDRQTAIIDGRKYVLLGIDNKDSSVISNYILTQIFGNKKYTDGTNTLYAKNGYILYNNEQYTLVLGTQFNESRMDYFTKRKGNTYLFIWDNYEVSIYSRGDLDMGFGITKGEFVCRLKIKD